MLFGTHNKTNQTIGPIVPLTVHYFPSIEVQEGPFTSTVTNEAQGGLSSLKGGTMRDQGLAKSTLNKCLHDLKNTP